MYFPLFKAALVTFVCFFVQIPQIKIKNKLTSIEENSTHTSDTSQVAFDKTSNLWLFAKFPLACLVPAEFVSQLLLLASSTTLFLVSLPTRSQVAG